MLEVQVEARHWHPVLAVEDAADGPHACSLLGQDLVVWRHPDRGWQAWVDRCPHRGARLSLGRLCEGRLECPYHGWRFDASGQCVSVPADPDFVPPATHRAQALRAQEAYGLVWVRLSGDAGKEAPPLFAAETDERLRKVLCGPYEVETSAPRIVENFLDMAHFSYVHEGWLGAREHPRIAPYSITPTAEGFLASDCLAWQPRSSLHAEGGAEVRYTYEMVGPYTAVLTKRPDPAPPAWPDLREAIALFIDPVAPDRSRVWFRLAMNDFTTPAENMRAFQHTIFMQDAPVLLSQSPRCLPLSEAAARSEVHVAADRSSAAYRRMLRDQGIRFGTF